MTLDALPDHGPKNRTIYSRARTGTVQLADCLGSLLALELMSPSPDLYLVSPWVSNVALLGSRFGQFRAVLPDANKGDIALAEVLAVVADRGARVRILCRPRHSQTEEFLRRLPPSIEHKYARDLHVKGLITTRFYLRGSMNFTYYGVNLNDEHVELTVDPSHVAYALIEARRHWESI